MGIGKAPSIGAADTDVTPVKKKGAVIFTHLIFIKARESVPYYIFWVRPLQSLPKECQEHCEINGTRSLVHHFIQIVITHVL